MFNNEEDVKKALREYLQAAEEVKRLIHYREPEADKSVYSEQEFETLRELLKKEKETKKSFFTLLFEKLKVNWSQEEIDKWMEENI